MSKIFFSILILHSIIVSCYSQEPINEDDFVLLNKKENIILSLNKPVEYFKELLGEPEEIKVVSKNIDDDKWDTIHLFWQNSTIIVSYMKGFSDNIKQITVRNEDYITNRGITIGISSKEAIIEKYGSKELQKYYDKSGRIYYKMEIYRNDEIIPRYLEIVFEFDDNGIVKGMLLIEANVNFVGYDL